MSEARRRSFTGSLTASPASTSASSGPHRFDLARVGAGLPVATAAAELRDAAGGGAMVVTAPPGTGKTTFVPPLIANTVPGVTLLTQPRRVAVRAAARRIAALDGSPLGAATGFTVRGERRVDPGARIEALTPGVLLRRLLTDPGLDGVGAVILDEVHERTLDGDLLLGMLADFRTLRDDLVVVAMSATMDAGRIAEVLGGAPIIDVPSALHPLTVEYVPPPGARLDARGVARAFLDHLAEVAVRAYDRAGDVDALVFLPGARDVDELTQRLRGRTTAEVLPLHGRLPSRQQDRATSGRGPGDGRRIIVSTALAESSLTVPGVRLVIDAGLSRQVRRDRERDMAGLVTVSASRSSAGQRAGRAAREAPGTVVRAYAETDFARMREADPPEISAADLTDAALLLAAWGTPGGEGLPLPDAPPPGALDDATSRLRALGLTGEDGLPTLLGRRVARLPVGVLEARGLLAGADLIGPRAAADVVAALVDDHRADGADLPGLLRDLQAGRAPGADRWRREIDRLRALAADDQQADATAPVPSDDADGIAVSERDIPGAVVALARPERIARRTGPASSRTYLLASGTRAALPVGSGLVGEEWLAVWEVQRADGRAADGTGAVLRLAAPLSEELALALGGALLRTERSAAIAKGKVTVREERRLGGITLTSTPVAARPEDTAPAVLSHLRETGLSSLTWTDAAEALRSRLGLLRRELGEPWPDVSDAALLADLEEWLGPHLTAGASPRLDQIDVLAGLRALLPWPEAAHLDELVPERLAVPSGSHPRITYPAPDEANGRPVVAVKLQEMFGLAETPRLVDGRVPVLFHLLSPARRPLAVTDDLRSFWAGPYQEVRKDMRGRYPKHPWPEDPWSAPATARTTRRMGGR
ncbi:MAG: ATP-dependent helicase HrpB [Brachybacterium sp.]|nr:ATP-dependent helicase HrpB [Brachybacterium sp.]